MWKTRITDMLGIEYPIIQGAFGGFGTADLAVPVSEAGGLGMITATALRTPEGLRQELRRARSMTDKPLGVNLTLMGSPHVEEMREVIIEEGGIPVVESAAARADVHGRRLQEGGIKWIHKVTTVPHALAAQAQGVDAVVLVGLEGAAFKSVEQLPTLVSVTWAAGLLEIPVIAAGGIGDARGFLAALVMGAEAVYMGTAFMATRECPIPERHKQALVAARPTEPKYRERCLSRPSPGEIAKVMERRGSLPEHQWLLQMERVMFGESAEEVAESAEEWSEEEVFRALPGSLAVGVIDKVPTVKEFVEGFISGAEAIRRRWSLA